MPAAMDCGPDHVSMHPDPVVLEFNRLQNQIKDKERELRKAQIEIRALKATDALKDKAVEELGDEVKRLEEKLRTSETQIEHKNLDIKKLTDEKREALAAQYAAEATLRRVYSDKKDDDFVPLETAIAPLEAELKIRKNEVQALQEDNKALERLIKSKESALLEAERILKSALERVLTVEEIQNQNFELKRQIEICQEENKILEKTNRHKISEVEKLSQTIKDLEEAVLASGAAASAIRDYKRQISELNEEKRTLERELARAKVSANRIANVVANEWKDENDKVMPVKQWLEERRLLQAEMQKLKDKLAISERTAEAEAQVKEKLRLRLKTLEEGLKHVSRCSVDVNGSPKHEKSTNFFGILSTNARMKKRSTSAIVKSPMQKTDEKPTFSMDDGMKPPNNLKKNLWGSRNKVSDSSGKENAETNQNTVVAHDEKCQIEEKGEAGNIKSVPGSKDEMEDLEMAKLDYEDMVSGFLYDRLQKEVICLRKACNLKENTLNTKNDEIKMLMKKIETLTRAIEVESKKMKREAAIRDRDSALMKLDDKTRSTNSSKKSLNAS